MVPPNICGHTAGLKKCKGMLSTTEDDRQSNVHCIGMKLTEQSARGALTTRYELDAGIFAVADKPIDKGECVLECYAAGIALDPPYRSSRCAFCSAVAKREQTCQECDMVAICVSCKSAEQWHFESGECDALQLLSRCSKKLFGTDVVDSVYLLTIRLLIRRWYDQRSEGKAGDNWQRRNPAPNSTRIVGKPGSLPPVDWSLFDMLYASAPSEDDTYQSSITAFCDMLRIHIVDCDKVGSDKNDGDSTSFSDDAWFTKNAFDHVLGRIVGCCHAITDQTLPLGRQNIGRALFLHHSFYNHSCSPNSFLSCHIGSYETKDEKSGKERPNDHGGNLARQTAVHASRSCCLVAMVYSICSVNAKEPINISYIPMSGIDCRERRDRLQNGYGFQCSCQVCNGAGVRDTEACAWEKSLKTPAGSDIESLREVQFSCNETLLQVREADQKSIALNDNVNRACTIDSCMMMIRMSMRGIQNQGITSSHEVSIEAHRLLAMALSLSGRVSEAVKEHCMFFECVKPITLLFDPVSEATQHLECAKDFGKEAKYDEQRKHLQLALMSSRIALGPSHLFTVSIEQLVSKMDKLPVSKKKKIIR